jgi:hypothetical protein
MPTRFSRRSFLVAAVLAAIPASPTPAQETEWQWSLPIGVRGDIPGNGFYLRHAYATENTSFYPGGWHTGENWYLLDGDTAGTDVYAVADGEIVYAGFDYPGPVVIVQHDDDLYSMYGHLDYDLAVESGPVRRGQLLGTVLDRTDGRSPSHLHFEIRRFLTTPEVNGLSPRYSFTCGPNCPPGPGYWPIDAPEHPSGMGWMNPTHVIARRAFDGEAPGSGAEVMVARGAEGSIPLWRDPDGGETIGELLLEEGARYAITGIAAGPEDSTATSAEGYEVMYQIVVPDMDEPVWARAMRPSEDAFGSDGRPSSLRVNLLPVVSPA